MVCARAILQLHTETKKNEHLIPNTVHCTNVNSLEVSWRFTCTLLQDSARSPLWRHFFEQNRTPYVQHIILVYFLDTWSSARPGHCRSCPVSAIPHALESSMQWQICTEYVRTETDCFHCQKLPHQSRSLLWKDLQRTCIHAHFP